MLAKSKPKAQLSQIAMTSRKASRPEIQNSNVYDANLKPFARLDPALHLLRRVQLPKFSKGRGLVFCA